MKRVRVWGRNLGMFSREELEAMALGERVELAGGLYAVCGDCNKVVRLNKPILGSLHDCRNPGGSDE